MMNILLQIWRRLFSLMRRGRLEREMEEEMRFQEPGGRDVAGGGAPGRKAKAHWIIHRSASTHRDTGKDLIVRKVRS